MPRKIRELKRDLRQAGFVQLKGMGKGSHSRWVHGYYRDIFVDLSGNDGHDAGRYQERLVDAAIKRVRERDQRGD